MRVGLGQDTHRLVPGRPLVIGGVVIPFEKGEDGHSDGDALIHAIIDALLGPAGLGDIGAVFPPGDPSLAGIDSRILLRRTRDLIAGAGWVVENVDAVVLLERPKLLPFISDMRGVLASDLGLTSDRVTVKAKSGEGMDAVGEGRAVSALATALLREALA
jgi:2-C-methyl-D-erythritol 2,4-cyclodiphosphate synthase